MVQEYPTIVYVTPGDCQGNGFTYGYMQVLDEFELKAALSEGYRMAVEPDQEPSLELALEPDCTPVTPKKKR